MGMGLHLAAFGRRAPLLMTIGDVIGILSLLYGNLAKFVIKAHILKI